MLCNLCRWHLGHFFSDGPEPAGRRYCINSVSLILRARKEERAFDNSSK
ncbi:peptide-methionine (R)-S-oxide reductase [Telluribacter sp.]